MLKGFLNSDDVKASHISVSDPDVRAQERAAQLGVTVCFDNVKVASNHDVLLIGTEPEDVPEVLEQIRGVCDSKMVISIAAGMRTDDLAKQLPESARVVRVMPNTPCVVGEMAAGFCFGEHKSV